jgi:hypothetical protein
LHILSRYLAGALIAVCPPCAAAQLLLLPGDSLLRTERISDGVDTIAVVHVGTDNRATLHGTFVRRIQRVGVGPGQILRATQDWQIGATTRDDTLEVAARTLAFRFIAENIILAPTQSAAINRLQLAGTRLVGSVITGAGQQPVDMAATPMFFDLAVEVFSQAWPSREYKQWRLPLGRLPDLRIRYLAFADVGSETLTTSGGPVRCRRVRSTGGAEFWLAESDGRLLRVRWARADGVVVWKVPVRDLSFIGELALIAPDPGRM